MISRETRGSFVIAWRCLRGPIQGAPTTAEHVTEHAFDGAFFRCHRAIPTA
jgi:hypothetical protein